MKEYIVRIVLKGKSREEVEKTLKAVKESIGIGIDYGIEKNYPAVWK